MELPVLGRHLQQVRAKDNLKMTWFTYHRWQSAWQSRIASHCSQSLAVSSYPACIRDANSEDVIGDLGLVAEEVEARLARIFHLAEQWDCVLLLDEADIFLAERTRSDLKRNSLVSGRPKPSEVSVTVLREVTVFLRVLEYYTGILFLTTNRVGAFDAAFKSRIHMHLYYPPLREKQTLSIWKMNLERTLERKKTLIADEKEIMDYALNHFRTTSPQKANWNGRQIRNAFQTATALAEYDRDASQASQPRLDKKYFDIVAKASLEFDQYMAATRDENDAVRAFNNHERYDEFKPSTQYRDHKQSASVNFQPQEAPQYVSGAVIRTPQRYTQPVTPTVVRGPAYTQNQHLAESAYPHTPPASAVPAPQSMHSHSMNETMLFREESTSSRAGGGWQRPQPNYNELGPPGMTQSIGSGDDDYE